MTDLKIALDNILNEKTTKLIPENLREGITCLGVTGNMKSPNLVDDIPEASLNTFSGEISGSTNIDPLVRNSCIVKDKLFSMSLHTITIYNYITGKKLNTYNIQDLIDQYVDASFISVGCNNPNNIGDEYYYIAICNTEGLCELVLYNYNTDTLYPKSQGTQLGVKTNIHMGGNTNRIGILSAKHNKMIETYTVASSAGGSSYGGADLYTIDFVKGTYTSTNIVDTDGFWTPYPVWLKDDRVLAISTFYNNAQWNGEKYIFVFDEDISNSTRISLQSRYTDPGTGFTFNYDVTRCFKGSDLYSVDCNLLAKSVTLTLLKSNVLPTRSDNYLYATNGIVFTNDGSYVLVKDSSTNVALYQLQSNNTVKLLQNNPVSDSNYITPNIDNNYNSVCTASTSCTTLNLTTDKPRQIYLDYNNKAYYNYSDNNLVVDKNNVLTGVNFLSRSGIDKGTMPNNGALNYTPSTQKQTIPEGYTSGGIIEAIKETLNEEEYNKCIALSDTILGNTISGYTPLNYIQSNGKQCIELNYQWSTANTKIELTTSDILANTNSAIFGNGLWTMSTPVLVSDSNLAYNYYSYGINVTTDLLTKHTMSFYRGVVILDGETISNTDTIHGRVSGNTILFGGTKNDHLSSFKLYSCRIIENDIIKLDLKPMMNEAGDIGLYDTIHNKFYTSTTSTKFIAG